MTPFQLYKEEYPDYDPDDNFSFLAWCVQYVAQKYGLQDGGTMYLAVVDASQAGSNSDEKVDAFWEEIKNADDFSKHALRELVEAYHSNPDF